MPWFNVSSLNHPKRSILVLADNTDELLKKTLHKFEFTDHGNYEVKFIFIFYFFF